MKLQGELAHIHQHPNYALDKVNKDMVEKVVDGTPFAKYVYFHKKKDLEQHEERLTQWFEKLGLSRVLFEDLDDL